MRTPALAFSSSSGASRRSCVRLSQGDASRLYLMVDATQAPSPIHCAESTALTGELLLNLFNRLDISREAALHELLDSAHHELCSRRAATEGGELHATAMLALITPERARLAWVGDMQAFWLRGADCQDSSVPHIFSQGDANLRVAPRAHLGGQRDPRIDSRDWAIGPGDRLVLTRGVDFHRDAELTLSRMLQEDRGEAALELLNAVPEHGGDWVGVLVHDV